MGVHEINKAAFPPDIQTELEGITVYNATLSSLKRNPVTAKALIAFANHRLQAIVLVDEHLEGMTDDALKVVLLHEVYHLKHPSASEEECDAYAKNIIGIPAYYEAVRHTKLLMAKLARQHTESEDFHDYCYQSES